MDMFKFKEFCHIIKRILQLIIAKFFSLMPVENNKILLENFHGNGFGDNPKYIAEEIKRQGLCCDLVWAVKSDNIIIPSWIRTVKIHSLRYYYELNTSHIIIINSKDYLPLIKKKEQALIQTWHGVHGYKKVESEAMEYLPRRYIKESKKNSYMTDYIISDGPKTTRWFKEVLWCDCKSLEIGFPRNDNYYKKDIDKKAIKKKLGILNNYKIVLYAPTFRDDGSDDGYDIKIDKLLLSLKKKFGSEWMCLVRFHPGIDRKRTITFDDYAKNVSDYQDVQELNVISDVLITDYSSIYDDFFIMNKPVFLYTSDLDSYVKGCRSLKKEFFDLFLKKNRNNEELNDDIINFDFDKYKKNITEYNNIIQRNEDGEASKKMVCIIRKVLS